MTASRARAYVRLRDAVRTRADLFDSAAAERVMRAADALLFARTWRDREASGAIADLRDLAADLLTHNPFAEVATILDLLEAVAPADLAERTAVVAA
jgi:hypothetical protein